MIRRTCLRSTLRLMPVIYESISLANSPSPSALTCSVQRHTRLDGLDPRQAAVAREADEARHPPDAVFGGARKVAEPGMRAHHHQHVGKAVHQDAEIGLRFVLPLIPQQPASIHTPDIDTVEAAGDRVEAGRVDGQVEFVLGVASLDAV